MLIRPARPADSPVLQDIEIAAGQAFADIGMAEVAGHEPPPQEHLAEFMAAGLAWVVAGEADRPVAYLIAEQADGCLHIEQVSVHPSAAGQRLGWQLIEQAGQTATAMGLPALTLTTFVNVLWNGPYYVRCGFRYLSTEEETPRLRAIRAREAALGLDAWPRACMRRDL